MLTKKEIYIRYAITILAAWAGAYGVSYLFSLKEKDTFSYGIVPILVFVLCFFVWEKWLKQLQTGIKVERRKLLYAAVFVLAVSVSYVMGYQLQSLGMTDGGFKGKSLILLRGACLSMTVFPLVYQLFDMLQRAYDKAQMACEQRSRNPKMIFGVSTLIIFVCWIPVFLAYYPAIMTFDFHRQVGEAARGFIWFNSYQPLAHTLLIWVALQIGNAVGSLETGMACYSIFQMLVLAVALGYVCTMVYRLVKKMWPVVLLVLFFGLFPFVSVLALCVTKDVIFTALFLIFMCLFVERSYFATGKRRMVLDILWVLEGLVMILFRNNALYAIAVFALFFVVMVEKKQKIRALVISLMLVIGGKGALEGIQVALGTTGRGSQVEMFSVPIQQFARVGNIHGEYLNEEDFQKISNLVGWDFWEHYNPPLSDTIKGGVGLYQFPYTWKGNYSGVLKTWAEIGLKYPNEYIDAFLALTCGYWFMDDRTWCEVLGYGVETRMGAIYTYNTVPLDIIPEGIAHVSKFPALEEKLEEIVSGNSFYEWPVLSVLCKPALYVWGLVLALLLALYFKERKKLMIMLLPFIYFGTLLLGPVVQIRYIFTIMVTVPLLLALVFYREDVSAVNNENTDVQHAEDEKHDTEPVESSKVSQA